MTDWCAPPMTSLFVRDGYLLDCLFKTENLKSCKVTQVMTSLVGQESVWKECVNQFDTPSHIFITGSAGCGKTTLMRELLQEYANQKKRPYADQWGLQTVDECLLLGPDQDRGIQTIRGQVSLFIRQMSVGENIFRWVVIDDVDTFPQISQQALRRPPIDGGGSMC